MGSTFEETVLDFDLNFFHHSSNILNDSRIDKQRKAILLAKKKTVATDSLIKKYYGKKEQLEQTEVVLLAAKEECKQVCIDYKDSLEKCTQLEKDVKLLQNENKELQSNCDMAQNQVEAIKSHAHQLQVLVKEHETVIEALKIENQLEKNNVKDYEKNLLNLQKENETLLNDLCLIRDIALGKKKLHKRYKLLLQKYEKANSKYEDDNASESSSEETDLFESSPSSPLFTFEVAENKIEENQLKSNENEVSIKKDTTRINEDNDSDCSNEIVSEDTGRGSSLAFSDGEKCYNSPDYFCSDSPFGPECNKTKERRVFVDACTSPTTVPEIAHIATSPHLFDDEALLSDNNISMETDSNSTEYFITDIPLSTEIVTIKERKKLVDVGTSTVVDIEKINVSTSPVVFQELDLIHKNSAHSATSPIRNAQNKIIALDDVNAGFCDNAANKIMEDALTWVELRHTTIQNLSSQCELEISDKSLEEQKTCLEKNNSNNLCNENSNDREIEMILNSMRLTEKLITPIPKTPVKFGKKDGSRQILSPVKSICLSELPKEHTVCPEATKLREENRVLQTSIADLSKEIMNIKCILKNQLLIPETPRKQLCEGKKKQTIISELFDDSSQETICINLDREKNSNSVDNKDFNGYVFSNKETSISPPVVESIVIREPVIQNVQDLPKGCQARKKGMSPTALRMYKSREISLNKETATVETSINSNTSETVSLFESRKTVEDNLRMEDEIEETLVCNNVKELVINDNKDKNVKYKKISRLERFRKKLLPKSKIKRMNVPIRKLHSKIKPVVTTKSKNTDVETLMNNKSAYENALKVMTELKLKKVSDEKESSMIRNVKEIIAENDNFQQREESDNNEIDLRHNSKEEHLTKNINTIKIKQPVVCLSQLKLRKDLEKEKDAVAISPKKSEGIPFSTDSLPTINFINTRSRSKINQESITDITVNDAKCRNIELVSEDSEECPNEYGKPVEIRRQLKRAASDNPSVDCKRVLRSQNVREMFSDHIDARETLLTDNNLDTSDNAIQKRQSNEEERENLNKFNKDINKSNECCEARELDKNIEQIGIDINSCPISHPKESVLCKMLEKFAKGKIKFSPKKIPDDISNSICKKLEEDIAKIIELPIDKVKSAMTRLVEEIQHSWNLKNFLAGFMKYLKDPARKRELFNKVCSPPAPPMTKSEQVLLFVMRQLEISLPNTVSMILTQIEFSLFQLNRSPEFDVIESLSHFYALLCRYFGLKNRLRLFLLDAMYCLQFKVVPLIKQCLDVWMHILPLAHMGIAKSPLVTCLVYLLHFYKCEDKFNRIQDIRFILNKKYFYQITDWNETKILEMFRNSIKELRDIKVEKKMLRMAFIILAKRQGPKWCQKNIIKKMLIPMLEKEDVPIRIKLFCVELIGPLLKPYPIDMKVHCEIIVNQLLDMLDQNTPDCMKEAIFTSLIYMNKHNQNRVTQSLLSWSPKYVSSEFEELMRDFVQEKPLKVWKGILSRTEL